MFTLLSFSATDANQINMQMLSINQNILSPWAHESRAALFIQPVLDISTLEHTVSLYESQHCESCWQVCGVVSVSRPETSILLLYRLYLGQQHVQYRCYTAAVPSVKTDRAWLIFLLYNYIHITTCNAVQSTESREEPCLSLSGCCELIL